MNNKIIGIIVAIIVIVAAIFLFTRQGSDSSQTAGDTSQTNSASEEAKPEAMSLKELTASKKNQTCTFATTDANYQSEGTVYIAGGKFRGDFKSTAQNQTTLSHMIYDGKDAYLWMDGQTTGFKMSIDANDINTDAQQSFDPNEKLDYDCDSWSPDNSKFNVPTNVQFTSMGQMTMPAGTPNSQDPCAALPEPAKSQCYSVR